MQIRNATIKNLTVQSVTTVTDGLVLSLDSADAASYPGSRSTWTDLSSSHKDFTLYNSPTYSNGALTFNRALYQSAESTSFPASLTTFTAETWVKFNTVLTVSGESTCTITEVYNSQAFNYTIGCGMDNDPGSWRGGYFDGSTWHLAGNIRPVTGVWYCMAVTYNGTYLKFYVNGELNDITATAVTPVSNGQGIRIAKRWDLESQMSSYLDGSVPVVKLYNRALSDAEVAQNYQALQSRYVG